MWVDPYDPSAEDPKGRHHRVSFQELLGLNFPVWPSRGSGSGVGQAEGRVPKTGPSRDEFDRLLP